MKLEHNDYEIICLAREGNDEALALMFKKYTPLIYKKIDLFHLNYDRDDMYQEGLMVLHKTLLKYEPSFNKTFTRFFEMNLERKLISIINKKVRRYEIFNQNVKYIYESSSDKGENSVYYELYLKELKKILTKRENLVYTLRELENYSIEYIKTEYRLDEKVIYNSLYRAKAKIKAHFR